MSNSISIFRKADSISRQQSYNNINFLPADFDVAKQVSIETGYFVFTMMPSLRCSLNCPHCYLTLQQRRESEIMTLAQLEVACRKVANYYLSMPHLKSKVIVFYWYGGEPTEMGLDYMLNAFSIISKIFPESDGYYIRHDILTSLVNVSSDWFDVFNTWGKGHFQTSFDGLMRGRGYVKKWDKRVRDAVSCGLSVSTISVVNNELMKDGPKAVLDYLVDLGVSESSFLPFMLNFQNKGDKYEKFAPPMSGYSDFMIDLSSYWLSLKAEGVKVPHIGQMSYVISRMRLPGISNIAAQTMFLLPNGDFVLPDYVDGYLEFMNVFGNIFSQDFKSVLSSDSRRSYIRKQYLRNRNSECMSCSNKNHCIMEFWKENRAGDDCFGASRYVDWIAENKRISEIFSNDRFLMF